MFSKSRRSCFTPASNQERSNFYYQKQRIKNVQLRLHHGHVAESKPHLLYPGLYILAGAPKIGKSWLALDLCLSVAEGEPFLKHETHRGQVLYLALEDSLLRLQNRLYEFTEEPAEGLQFSTLAKTIGGGLEQQLEDAKRRLPDLRLIVIDTLQKVRRTVDVSSTV